MQVTWRSDYPLPCACGYAAPVVLCLRDGLVANYPTRTTIEASLLYSNKLSCGGGYQHTFDYDPTLIVDEQQLFQIDITGAVCAGCWKEYVDDQLTTEFIDINVTPGCCGTYNCLVGEIQGEMGCWYDHSSGRITGTNSLTPIDGLGVPTYFDTDTSTWVEAIADSTDHLATFLALSGTADYFDTGNYIFACVPKVAEAVEGQWYAVSPTAAGELVLESSLDPNTDIIQRAVFILSQADENQTCIFVALNVDATEPVSGGSGWALTGNASTTPGTNFVGTTDNVAHEMKANGKRLRRIEYVNDFGSIILDGAAGNESNAGALQNAGCSILGGGGLPSPNHVFWVTDFNSIDNGYFSTICGGRNNYILGDAVNSGGDSPAVFVGCSIIGGGFDNYITNLGPSGLEEGAYYEGMNGILAGFRNLIQGPSASAICAGTDNGIDITDALDDTYSADNFIGAGSSNYIQIGFGVTDTNFIRYSSITAGLSNYIENGFACHIGGGEDNEIYSNPSGTRIDDSCILGGASNQINGSLSSVHGGQNNWVTGTHGHIFGGGRLLMDDYCCGIQNYQTRTLSSSFVDLSAFTGVFYSGDYDLWIGNTDNTARKLKFFEPNTDLDFSSANFSSFRAQAQAANIEYIWPATAGSVNQRLTITNVAGTVVTLGWAA